MAVAHGGDVWQGGNPEQWLDFSANLNPDGPPGWVLEAMAQGLAYARYYPDLKGAAARRGVAEHLGINEDCVLVTAGGIEAAAMAAVMPGECVIVQPTFQEYGRLCKSFRSVNRERLHEYPLSEGETLWLCNPNNPTGDALSRDEVAALLAKAERAGARLIVDEAFIEYCPGRSVADLAAENPSLVVLGSLTKVLAIPGVRLGYMVATPHVTSALAEALLPWRLNCLADAVAAALPGYRDDFDRICATNAERRTRFAQALSGVGAEVHPSEANFLLCDFGRDMRPAIEALRREHILLRPCGMFPGLTHGHVRLCVRTDAENGRLVEWLKNEELGIGN